MRLNFILVLNKDRYRNKDGIIIFSQQRCTFGFLSLPIMIPATIGVLYLSFKKCSQWVVIKNSP